MRIGILAKGGKDWIGGVHYTLNLIRALRSLPTDEQPQIVLLMPGEADRAAFHGMDGLVEIATLPADPHPTAPTDLAGRPAEGAARSTENVALVKLLTDLRIDLVYPCMRSLGTGFPTAWLPWIPDLQHRHYPDFFSPEERANRDRTYSRLADDALLVVFSSETALADFDRFFPGRRSKLRVLRFATVPMPEWFANERQEGDTHCERPDGGGAGACHSPNQPHDSTARAVQQDRKSDVSRIHDRPWPARYLMLPNQFWVHKNHRVAFEAAHLLVGRGLDVHLVCTGGTEDPRRPEHGSSLRRFIDANDLSDRIHILGMLPRMEQIQLMRRAAAIVQPSLFEGWSTVVEDARALGKPIFLSDIPVHREQNPPRAIYFDPDRPAALADAVQKAWSRLGVGPCPADEEKAVAAQGRLVQTFARQFLRLAGEHRDLHDRRGMGLDPRATNAAPV